MSYKRFKKVYLEISNICNLKCSFCPAVERGEQQVAEDTFKARLLEVSPWAERVCLHVMGEPLAHPLLPRFIEIAGDHQVDLEITTNGTLLSASVQASLLHKTVKQVNFSLQSFTDNFPTANPLTYLNKIFGFIDQAFIERPDLYINLRLWNIGDHKAGQDTEFFLKQIESKFDVQINRSVDVGFKKSKNVKSRLYIHFDSRFIWPDLKHNKISDAGSCYGTRSQVAVLADGVVVPCCLDKEAAINLGVMGQTSFADIVDGTKATRIRQGFEQGRMLEDLCQRCDYAQRFKKKAQTVSAL
ncbi:MAG: radical SAM protein [Bdellovibrionaceae bacterium]|nr:radical SAM protein [Pseudobdellovibrionaceae bacterium]